MAKFPRFRKGMGLRDFKSGEMQRMSSAAERFENMHVASPLYIKRTPSGVTMGMRQRKEASQAQLGKSDLLSVVIVRVPSFGDFGLTVQEVIKLDVQIGPGLMLVGDPIENVIPPPFREPIEYRFDVDASKGANLSGPFYHAFKTDDKWYLLEQPEYHFLPKFVLLIQDDTIDPDAIGVPIQRLLPNPQTPALYLVDPRVAGAVTYPGYTYSDYAPRALPEPEPEGEIFPNRAFSRIVFSAGGATGATSFPSPYNHQFHPSVHLDPP